MDRHHDSRDSGFGAWVSVLNRAAQIYFGKVFKGHGPSPGELAYLLTLRPGTELTQDEVAASLMVDKANVARAVRSLGDAGLVSRRRPDDDKRCWLVGLTPEGIRVRSLVEERMQKWVQGIRDAISEEQWGDFVSTLETVAIRAMRFAVETDPIL